MDILSEIKELLKQTSVENEFDKYWNLSNLQYGGIKQHIERENLENEKHDSISLYRLISEGMNSFLRSYPTSPLYKAHKMKPVFLQWNKRIADKLDVKYTTEDWDNYIDKNIIIEIVKLLQTRKGIRVSELADKLGVSEKTIRSYLRLIDSQGTKSKYSKQHVSVGGYPLTVNLKSQFKKKKSELSNDIRASEKYYNTPNTVHPLVLFPNVVQTGTLIESLANQYCETNSEIALSMGIDIWFQLTDYCKQRIRLYYYSDNVKEFIRVIESDVTDDYILTYLTEQEQFEKYMNDSERLVSVAKRNRYCNITLTRDGEQTITLYNQKIRILKNYYEAFSDNESCKTVRFTEDDEYEIEIV